MYMYTGAAAGQLSIRSLMEETLHNREEVEEVEEVEVVVVGAGMAGLSAACRLSSAGIKTRVLEARGRVGGRVMTVQHDGKVLELGAQWLHGGCHANNLFNFCLSEDLLGEKVRTLTEGAGHFYTSSGRVIDKDVSDRAWELYEELNQFRHLQDRGTTESLRDAYWEFVDARIEGDTDKEDLQLCMGALSLALSGYVCDDLSLVSAQLYAAGTELPGGDVIVPGGLASVVDTMVNIIPGDVIKTGKKVTNIDWSGPDVVVTTNSESYICQHVIVTIPLGVLKKSHTTLFSPNLSDDKALSDMREGRICKIFLEWSKPWWTSESTPINLGWSREEVEEATEDEWERSVFNFSPVEGQERLLVCWVTGQAAVLVDGLEDDQIIARLSGVLRRFTGDPALPPADLVLRHRWTDDPDSLGAYSVPGLASRASDLQCLMRPEPSPECAKVMLAGEHTQPRYWSFLHGARLAGIQQADHVISIHNAS